MNTQSDAMSDTMDVQRAAPAALSPTRPLYWSVRRELLENRWIYIGQLAIAALFLLGFLITTVRLPAQVRALSGKDPMQSREALASHYEIAAGVMMGTLILMSLFYCADALHGERRDRSILFWKSLPVSDGLTVAAKFLVALVVVPLGAVALALLAHLLLSVILAVRAAFGGLPVAPVWDSLEWLRNVGLMLVLLLLAMLWYAPLIAAALLLSGWARKPFLWATLPPLMVLILEPIFLRSSYFWHFLQYRSQGIWGVLAHGTRMPREDAVPHSIATALFANLNWRAAFADIDLWLGVLVALALLYGATRLRRYHDET